MKTVILLSILTKYLWELLFSHYRHQLFTLGPFRTSSVSKCKNRVWHRVVTATIDTNRKQVLHYWVVWAIWVWCLHHESKGPRRWILEKILFGVLQENDIMLDQTLVDDMVDVKLESPRHGDFFVFDREIHKMSYNLVLIWFFALGLDGNPVTLVRFYSFFLDISAPRVARIAHSYFLIGHETGIKKIFDENRRVKGDRHV